jgi:hypothetical protein
MTHLTNKLMIGAAIGALMVSGAFAQSPNVPAGSTAAPPAATQPAPAGKAAPPAASMTSTTAEFVASQKPDQWLASKFKGTDVLGSDNQKIGDVSDILFDKGGKIDAYVVSVGGFLGMGAKEVALAPAAFQVVPGDSAGAPKLKTTMTKDQLTNAQNFARYEPPRPAATTGTGSGSGLGGARPSSNTAPTGR